LLDVAEGLSLRPVEAAGGLVAVWLDRKTARLLGAARGRAESYSEAILRLARAEA
jgi:hypothetical protein